MRNLDELGPHHRLMAVALAGGAKAKDVAAQFGMHDTTVSSLRADPLFAAAEAEANAQIRKRVTDETIGEFAELRRLALEGLTGVLTREVVFLDESGPGKHLYKAPPSAVVQAARVVLDRTDATRKAVEHSGEIATVTADDIAEALAARMRAEE